MRYRVRASGFRVVVWFQFANCPIRGGNTKGSLALGPFEMCMCMLERVCEAVACARDGSAFAGVA